MAQSVRLPIFDREDLDEAIKELSKEVKVQRIAFGAIFGSMALLVITILFISGKCLLGGACGPKQVDDDSSYVIK